MPMRLSGLMSGMDTESIIQDLVAAKRVKVDDAKKAQTKLGWKQEAWKELNNKIKKLYNGTMYNLRYQSSYMKKTTAISNSSIASIITSDAAMNSVQSLKVNKLANSGYLTGAEVKKTDGGKCTSATRLADMGIAEGSRIEVNAGGKTTEIEVTASMTIADLTGKLNSAGVKANFDAKSQRFFVGASASGAKSDFTITANNAAGTDALKSLGMLVYDEKSIAQYQKYADMRTDTAAYQKAVDKEAAARLKTYKTKSENIGKSIETLEERQQKIKDEYAEHEGWDDFDTLVNDADALQAMKDRKEALEAQDGLSEEEQTEFNDIRAKLSFVEAYQLNEENINKLNESLDEVNSYIAEDGAASDKLISEVEGWLDDKITRAEELLADEDALKASTGATKIKGQDAEIVLNGATFTASDNTFEINGLTITCNATTAENEEVTLTTQEDTSGIYNMIKDFIKEYSSLINEMDKLYNADVAKGYEPLTDDEKYEMSEKEIEKWEDKVKESLLRRDSTLNTVSSAFKQIMSASFTVGGKSMNLSSFGISTLGYFEAEDNERNAYHINGDEDDDAVKNKDNDLKTMISQDSGVVIDFFSQLTKSLYEKTSDLMKGVQDYSSSFTVYEDKKMKSDYDDYTKKIAQLEAKLAAYEDKWYSKFSAMETAMAKMQSNASAITGLLGGS